MDAKQRKIGFTRAEKTDANAYAFALSKGESIHFTARAFFKWIGWRSSDRILLPLIWNASERRFEAEVPQEHKLGSQNYNAPSGRVGFELFEQKLRRLNPPVVRIHPGQQKFIGNIELGRILREADVQAVLILWDQGNQRVAFQAVSPGTKNAFTVTRGTLGQPIVTARGLLKRLGWSAKKTLAFPATWNPVERMVELTLPAEYVKGARKPK